MKQNLINDVIQAMIPHLNNAQAEKLQTVLQHTLFHYEIVESENKGNSSEQNLVGLLKKLIAEQVHINLAKQIAAAQKEGDQLGLTADELAFYDALTKPQAIKDFYENEELIAITKELADTLRKNKTVDWQKRESARAKMRMLIKKLLKKHKYPPEGMEDAVQTVMIQCELWTDNNDMSEEKIISFQDKLISYSEPNYKPMMVAESVATYETRK